ncbi:hypothetical protein GUJ93_ZPchr0006g45876 [Zizania palustris]|uniref:Uncharacterized protein n=1 Tax=Zizania palustris TaxID=103762 RepID=A0A8J5VWQ8_ZIZPA|nr:hypothetical protein GUJ93_ZPchr0006g45876 [Zizania palustris]
MTELLAYSLSILPSSGATTTELTRRPASPQLPVTAQEQVSAEAGVWIEREAQSSARLAMAASAAADGSQSGKLCCTAMRCYETRRRQVVGWIMEGNERVG